MNLLIVDDEDLTRSGLIETIAWSSLGIDNIYEADDGIHGVAMAKQYHPDIILSDVRMPRMDGITMAKTIRGFLPDCSIVFMSGYSDKEYLKSAIKLKVLSYVEKPIDCQELVTALEEAVSTITELQHHMQSKQERKQEQASLFALSLTSPAPCSFSFSTLSSLSSLPSLPCTIKKQDYITTLLLLSRKPYPSYPSSELQSIMAEITKLSSKECISLLFAQKNEDCFVFQLFSSKRLPTHVLQKLSHSILSLFTPYSPCMLTIGKTIKGLEHSYHSYQSAVVLLQNAFFYEPNSVIEEESLSIQPVHIPSDLLSTLEQHLRQQNEVSSTALLTTLYDSLHYNRSFLPNSAKELYYQLFTTIMNVGKSLHYDTLQLEPTSDTAMGLISSCYNLTELQDFIMDKLSIYFKLSRMPAEGNSMIFLIKDYISKYFNQHTLSVKDISDHVHLSPTYVCTLFKTETGLTLNQYLTEYRIDQAKHLLLDPRNKITDISKLVGYNDSNYFGKTFKKMVGTSPSEYREQYLR